MYKPNGEEPMSKQEELRIRRMLAEKAAARQEESQSAETLRSAFYSALYNCSRVEEGVGANFEPSR